MAILTWELYSSLHNSVTEDEFERYEALAEKSVSLVIGPIKWANITTTTPYYDVLKDCIANTIDAIKLMETSAAGKGISSVSNDGYSESYALTSAAAAAEETRSQIRAWLSGTGLVGAY